MPIFDFTKKFIKKDINNFQILIDGKDFMEQEEYKEVKKLEFISEKGIIKVDGFFNLSNKNIQNLISISNLSISFSKELIESFKLKFDQPQISLIFYLLPQDVDIIKNNINILKKKYKNFDTDYKTYIKFMLTEFKDINILLFLKGEEKIEIKESIKEEKGTIKEEMMEEKEGLKNPFLFINPEEEQEENKEKEKKEEIITKKNDYIKMKNMNKFIFPLNKNVQNKLIYKYLSKNNKIMNENLSNNYSLSINSNIIFSNIKSSSSKNNNKIDIVEFKNIFFNEELKDLKESYQNNVILNFVNLLINNKKYDDNNSINKYTIIVLSLIKNIKKEIIDLKKNNINNEMKLNYYIQRLQKIISSLKLFHILFLNCFLVDNDINKNNFDENELFDNFFSLKVQTMRKKLLIEWCIEEEKEYLKKKDLVNKNKELKKGLLSKQIISFGQIKTAINSNNKKNIFINSKLSNLDKSNKIFSYFINNQKKSNISKTFILYEPNKNGDNIKNNWISFLLQSLLYIENSNDYITKSIKLIESKIGEMNNFSKPYIPIKINNESKNVYQLDYLLLKIYEKIIDGKGLKDISDIEQYINMLSYNNVFNNNNSDHFTQYIILYLLISVFDNIFPKSNNNNILIKKHYFLLNQILEEILCISNNEENLNLILIIKLLHTSRINKKLKQKILFDIICHNHIGSIQDFWKLYDNEKENISFINEETKEEINGINYINENNWKEAYKCFLKSKKYKISIIAFINYFYDLIKEEKDINEIDFNEIYNDLNKIKNEASFLFIDFYKDFYQFIYFMANKEKCNYEDIIDLFKKYIYEYNNNNDKDKEQILYLDGKIHRIIIKLLYQLLLLKDKQNNELILGGDEGFIKLNNILFEDKKVLLSDIFNDIIEHKNIQFSFE